VFGLAIYRGYIGTYSKGDSKGVYTFTLDTNTKEITDLKLAAELKDATYVTISDDNQFLYAVMKEGDAGGIQSFSINAQTGALEPINKEITADGGPCHISVDKAGKRALSANYHSGMIHAFALNNDGSIAKTVASAKHKGNGPNAERQEKAHAHFAGFTPDERYIVAVDLGTDEVVLYTLDGENLAKHFTFNATPGSGPRHIAFHPTEPYAYIMTELSNEVIVCAFDAIPGTLKEIQVVSTLPEGYEDLSQGSAIHVSRDGKFVYVGNRGHNSITSFRVNEHSGELSLVEFVSTEGNWPRDFRLDPTESIVVASNQESGDLTVYSRNKDTGKLSLHKANISVPYPVCVAFLSTPL
jgi:6-phosphogluconolactonase